MTNKELCMISYDMEHTFAVNIENFNNSPRIGVCHGAEFVGGTCRFGLKNMYGFGK